MEGLLRPYVADLDDSASENEGPQPYVSEIDDDSDGIEGDENEAPEPVCSFWVGVVIHNAFPRRGEDGMWLTCRSHKICCWGVSCVTLHRTKMTRMKMVMQTGTCPSRCRLYEGRGRLFVLLFVGRTGSKRPFPGVNDVMGFP